MPRWAVAVVRGASLSDRYSWQQKAVAIYQGPTPDAILT